MDLMTNDDLPTSTAYIQFPCIVYVCSSGEVLTTEYALRFNIRECSFQFFWKACPQPSPVLVCYT